MSDQWYFFHQAEAKSSWTLALASERDKIVRELKPELCTVLDVNHSFDTDLSSEDKDKIKYRGPFYVDFDSEDLEEVIPAFKEFLTNLRVKGANLDSIRLFCSGGKGFHIEMPASMLMGKVPIHGVQFLPLIYKEIAHELYVNTLDLRVYSQGKGRQWRNANVKRANGKHKVQITAEEALNITPERYLELIAHPRPLFPVETAVFTADLALEYSKAREKVENGIRSRKKSKKGGNTDLLRFKGEWPETLQKILAGEGLKDNVGWNYIAVQLAITATALGKTEDQFLADASGLIETYHGDSTRYGTPNKRRAELRKQYQYHSENPCYEYSIGGILSLVTKETVATTDLTLGEYVADGSESEAETPEEEEKERTLQVRVNSHGMYSKTENGWRNISHLGFWDPVLLRLPNQTEPVGYDVEVLVNGVKQGRRLLNIQHLATRASLHAYAMTFNASFRGTDMDAAHLLDLMRHKVESKSKIALVTQVEGIDLILPPDAESENDLEIVWSSPDGVISTGKHQYTYRPLASETGTYRSDLWDAPALSNCDEDREMVADLLRVNTPQNLARILGWYAAAFACPILRRFYSQFPLLQVYGGASAGKSKTIELVSHLHYHLHKPKIIQSSGITQYPLLVAAASTSSIPMVYEELRARFLKPGGKYEMVMNMLKSNYDGHSMERGALGDRGKGPVVNEFANTAPMAFVAEEMNGEVAIQERSISVCMSQADRLGRDEFYRRLKANATNLGRLGKSLAVNVMAMDIPAFREQFGAIHEAVEESMGQDKDGKDRPIYNLAVTVMGVRMLQRAVSEVFGEEFDEDFNIMADSVMGNVAEYVPKNMSEASRVLDTLAQLSKVLDVQFKMEHGRDYTVNGRTVDIKMKPAYSKYMRYTRSLGGTPLYDSDQAFISAMGRYEGLLRQACPDNAALYDNPFEPIYRFSLDFLEKESVEPFRS